MPDNQLETRYSFSSFTGTTPTTTAPTLPSSGATTGASAAGGADPVTAIANAVGKLFDFGKSVLANTQLNRKAWLERLNESVPIFHNWDAERIDKSKEYLYVIGFLVFLIAIIVLAIVFKNKNVEHGQ